MKLLTFAHRPEAQAFFDAYPVKSTPLEGLFQSDFGWILITGEGIYEAIARVSRVLGLGPEIKMVLNLGVAGSLDGHHEIGQIIEVRTSYGFDEKALFKSFTLSGNVDCVTSGKRIFNDDLTVPLLAMGSIVDRELWGVCYAAKLAGISVRSFKYISDKVGSLGACEVVKEKAQEASLALLESFKSVNEKNESTSFNLKGFYLTFSQEHQIKTLVHKLCIKWEMSESEVLAKVEAPTLGLEKILPKERTKKLIEALKKSLDPWGEEFESFQKNTLKELTHVAISSPTHFQTEELRVNFSFKSEEELGLRVDELKKINWGKFFESFQVKDV